MVSHKILAAAAVLLLSVSAAFAQEMGPEARAVLFVPSFFAVLQRVDEARKARKQPKLLEPVRIGTAE